jgi:hypothetical protein
VKALHAAALVAIPLAALLVAEPARASAPTTPFPEPDAAVFTGIGYGLLAASGVLIGEAMLGAEYNSLFIEPPSSWINVLGGAALLSIAVATEPHESRTEVERGVAAGVTGALIGSHGALSLLVWLLDDAWRSEVDLALTLDPRAGPSLALRGPL